MVIRPLRTKVTPDIIKHLALDGQCEEVWRMLGFVANQAQEMSVINEDNFRTTSVDIVDINVQFFVDSGHSFQVLFHGAESYLHFMT